MDEILEDLAEMAEGIAGGLILLAVFSAIYVLAWLAL